MDNTTDLPGKQTLDSITPVADSKQQDAHASQTRRRVVLALWMVGLVALLVASVIVRSHPAPWPFEVQSTTTMQQLQLWPWLSTPIVWASLVDNPIPSTASFVAWFVVLSLIGVVVWRKGGSPIPWFVTAIFISFGTPLMAGLNRIIATLVARPRPTSPPIHVFMPETGIPSFPSGHVENDVVYYGFLLYLSLTKPISQWRYRWLLIPFQLYFVLNILFIGYSRVLEGSHWLNDALGGYLAGALSLVLLIFLYRWTLDRMTRWYARRSALTTREPQPSTDTMHKKSLETVQVVEKKAIPYEELFIKCKDDWIHHLAQALAFSLLTAIVPIAILLLSIFSRILGILDTQTQQILTGQLDAIIPSPLSSQAIQVFNQAYDAFSKDSAIVVVFTFLLAVLLGSFLFSLMETCFDVIFHLPPRPFLRRHIVALGMLCLYVALAPIIILASAAPALILSLLHVIPPGNIPESNLIFRLATIGGSIILSLILFEALYVVVPHRHVAPHTIGRHIRNSWRGALVATIALELCLQFFPIYATFFLKRYIGQLGFVLILLLYFYLFTLFLLFGAEVNAFFAEGIRVPQSDLITQASKGGYR